MANDTENITEIIRFVDESDQTIILSQEGNTAFIAQEWMIGDDRKQSSSESWSPDDLTKLAKAWLEHTGYVVSEKYRPCSFCMGDGNVVVGDIKSASDYEIKDCPICQGTGKAQA